VQIGWWDGDRLWRTFMNKEGTVKPRYEASKTGPQLPMNKPLSKEELASATVEPPAAKAARTQARDAARDEDVGEERRGDQDILDAISGGNPQNVNAAAAGGIARAANLAAARVAAGNASNR